MFINKFLIWLSRGNEKQIIVTCLIELVLTLISTLIALLIASAVWILVGKIQILFFTHISQLFICVFFLLILKFYLSQKKAIIATKCGIQIKNNLRDEMLQKLFVLGPAYTSKNRTGDITTSIFSKIEWLNQYYTIYLPVAVSSLINAVIIIVVIFRFDWLTACVCIIACVGLLGCPMIFYNLMKERGKKEWQANAEYYSDCLDSIQGITTLKAFNASERQKKKIHEGGEDLRIKVMEHLKVTMLENGVLEFFVRLGSAFSIAVAAIRCATGHLEPQMLVYNLFLIGACFAPMLSLISAWHIGYRGVTGSFSVYELLNEPVKFSLYPGNHESIGSRKIKENRSKQFNGDISFDNVSFAYNESEGNVVNHVSFKIPNKTITALVGSSGGGKSTLAHLLAGFYPVKEGCIQVGESVVSERTVDKIQSLITVVWQDSHVFYGTAFENILMGNPNATYDEVIEAAKKANIHDFIKSLPEGYDTNLGEGGIRFSGGERQRIAIARAFLKDCPIVIFDEATSSLDRKNEIEIQKSFNDLSQGKTVLVIAHRLSTIQNANQICIIEDGSVNTFGTHDELIRSSELYRMLIGDQLKKPNKVIGDAML